MVRYHEEWKLSSVSRRDSAMNPKTWFLYYFVWIQIRKTKVISNKYSFPRNRLQTEEFLMESRLWSASFRSKKEKKKNFYLSAQNFIRGPVLQTTLLQSSNSIWRFDITIAVSGKKITSANLKTSIVSFLFYYYFWHEETRRRRRYCVSTN